MPKPRAFLDPLFIVTPNPGNLTFPAQDIKILVLIQDTVTLGANHASRYGGYEAIGLDCEAHEKQGLANIAGVGGLKPDQLSSP